MRTARRAFLLLVPIGFVAPLHGWSPESQKTIAIEAARLAPADLARQLNRYSAELQRGALAPFRGTDEDLHRKHPDGNGRLDGAIVAATDQALASLHDLRPFSEVMYRLGVVSHYVADLNNPLNTSGDDPAEGRYYADYLTYMERTEPRFALVLYRDEPRVESRNDLLWLIQRGLSRGRELYPLVGLEYQRIAFGSSRLGFDDRSTAFGVAALAFSHAVSDIAQLFRYIWVESGGTDRGSPLEQRQASFLQLPRASMAPGR